MPTSDTPVYITEEFTEITVGDDVTTVIVEEVTEIIESQAGQGPAGPQGAVGPQGPQGAVGPQGPEGLGDKNATYDFTNQSTVVFVHNLNKYPAVTVIDSAGDECVGEVDYDSLNQVTARFASGFTGKIICN